MAKSPVGRKPRGASEKNVLQHDAFFRLTPSSLPLPAADTSKNAVTSQPALASLLGAHYTSGSVDAWGRSKGFHVTNVSLT